MKKRTLIIVTAIFGLFLLNSNAIAGYLDSGWENITVFDGIKKNTGNKQQKEWWNNKNEDEEVEPKAQIGQQWDLEGFFLSDGTDPSVQDNELAMVGGFNFVTGQGGIASGDIFIDTDMKNGYYEYVMDLDFSTFEYTVYESTEESKIGYITPNKAGPKETKKSPWTYKKGTGSAVSGYQGLALNYLSSGVGGNLKGSWHNVATVNLSFLGGNTDFQVLNTMQCGNDIMYGGGTSTAAVPEPATIFLLGSGLLGLFGFRKKLRKSNN